MFTKCEVSPLCQNITYISRKSMGDRVSRPVPLSPHSQRPFLDPRVYVTSVSNLRTKFHLLRSYIKSVITVVDLAPRTNHSNFVPSALPGLTAAVTANAKPGKMVTKENVIRNSEKQYAGQGRAGMHAGKCGLSIRNGNSHSPIPLLNYTD